MQREEFEIFRKLIFRKLKNFRKVKGSGEDDGYKRKLNFQNGLGNIMFEEEISKT